jgi:hypothetical protein
MEASGQPQVLSFFYTGIEPNYSGLGVRVGPTAVVDVLGKRKKMKLPDCTAVLRSTVKQLYS